ncbi:MAG: hypothetical protein U9Q82_10965 [Chloroflexota bacterium]|nr:hypothetical protein [Chloroflexota bacterium]
MVRKRHKRSQSTPRNLPDLDVMASGVDRLEDMLFETLLASDVLVDEPEFVDLYFDENNVIDIAEKIYRKYKKKLHQAEKKGIEEVVPVHEDMQIEVIDRILTPEIRADILIRLERLLKRLKPASDMEKVVMVSAVHSALTTNIPWGLCGLIFAIFQRTLDEAKPTEEEFKLRDDLAALVGEDLTPDEITKMQQDPEFLKELEEKIADDHDFVERLTSYTDKMIDDFYADLWNGNIQIILFEENEIVDHLSFLGEYREEIEILDKESTDSAQKYRDFINLAIDKQFVEIMTPKRIRKLKKDIHEIIDKWAEAGHKYTQVLQMKLNQLDEEGISENHFIRSVFLNQVHRLTKETIVQKEIDVSQKESQNSSPKSKTRRGRRGKSKSS